MEREGPIISPSISDFVYDVYCLKKLVLIHDDTQIQMNAFHLRLRPFKTATTSSFIFPQPFKSNIAMRAKFNFHTELFKRIIHFSRAQIGSGDIIRTLLLLKP